MANGPVSVIKTFILSLAPCKTTTKTYVSIIRYFKKQPQKGVFFALKVPGDVNLNFAKVCGVALYLVQLPPYFNRVSEKKQLVDQMLYKAKSAIFAILGYFSHKRAPGDATGITFENMRMLLFPLNHVLTSCKISEKYNVGC